MATAYRLATGADLPAMAAVYAAAFPDSLAHFFPHGRPPVEAIADLLAIPLQAEAEAAWVAEVDGRIAGYCLAPARVRLIARAAFTGGHIWPFLCRWIGGHYGLGVRALWLLGRDKLRTRQIRRADPHDAEAHILSLAVHPDFQGRGLGKRLLEEGLRYLDSRQVDRIRLEVRPENVTALRLYENHGFETVGRTRDSQGDWLIMIRPGKGSAGIDQ